MAVRTFAVASFTTEAVADVTNMTNSKYMALQGGLSTQVVKIKEVYAAGFETSTAAPQKLLLAFDGTVATNITALTTGESDVADVAYTTLLATVVIAFTAQGTTAPKRAKAYVSQVGFNALGGLTRIRFPVGEEPTMIGASAYTAGTAGGEISLSGFTGTTPGVIGAHIKYEPL